MVPKSAKPCKKIVASFKLSFPPENFRLCHQKSALKLAMIVNNREFIPTPPQSGSVYQCANTPF